jgi:HSP20 family protein
MADRPARGSGSYSVHQADELEVYFSEMAHGRPVGFVASPKWKPRCDVYETADALIVHVDIAGMSAGDFQVEVQDGVLMIAGERRARGEGKRHYHSMEVQVGPFERRLRLPVPVDPRSMRATYESGFLEVHLAKLPERRSGTHSVKVE